MTNKRRHKRFSITGSADLTYRVKEKNQTIHTLISDVSLSGIGLYIDVPLEDGADVSLHIAFITTDGSIKADTIDGRIVYVRQFEEVYFTGIEFREEINQKNQPSLYEHLRTILMLDK
jgi:hypothetical protein